MAVKKNAEEAENKSVKKTAAKTAAKSTTKSAAKPAEKVAAKSATKTAAKTEKKSSATKATATKTAAKAATAKTETKTATKTVAKTAAKSAATKTETKAATKAATKTEKKSSATKTAATKTAAKAATAKTETKPATKTVAKTAAKSTATKAETKAATKATTKAETKAATKTVRKSVAKSTVETAAKLEQSFDAEYLVLMQKDPNWLHAFWEVSEERMEQTKNGKGKLVLRLFDISNDLTVQRGKKRKFHDVAVPADARSWYVENPVGNSCMAVLGSVEGDRFMPILESSPVLTFDKNAVVPSLDDEFVRASLGGSVNGNFMSSGFSSTTAESWLNSLRLGSSSESMFSGALSSAALKSNEIAAPKDSVNYGKDFFLWVKTRLIVYGGTRPDAHLQVRGEPFPLNPDGTFSFEEDLPDSTKIIPVFATDKDGDFPTTIVPIVVKRTE